jgi:methylenetetrahydrofolate dehydrogenase (NADP+)/methenyltetrahydrofolate cyclohydrolase
MILDGKVVEQAYLEELLRLRRGINFKPKLKVLSDGSEDSRIYERSIRRIAEKLEVEVLEDEEADGIISLGKREVEIPPELDIEGLSPENLGLLVYGKPRFFPPTPYAAIKILEFYGFNMEGKTCAIVGRSVRVGKPLSLLVLMKNGTPIIAHTKTQNLMSITRQSDFVFLCAGIGVVDISTVYRDGRIVGDAKFGEVKDFVRAITPVPGGVGRITPLVLFENLFMKILHR